MHRLPALMLVFLVACSGGSVAPANDETPRPADDGNGVAPNAVEASCEGELGDLLSAMQELDGRLTVGLNFSDYSARVGDANVAYERLDISDIEPNCLERVAVPLENALNAYIDANNVWNDCIQDADCDNDSITPTLQEKWAEATEDIDKAAEALNE